MGENNIPRRTALQMLLSAGIPISAGIGSGLASDRVSQNDDDIVMDEEKYSQNHWSSQFGQYTLTNSGGITYEKKKYAPAPSTYTWQYGSWVNASDASSEVTGGSEITYWSGSKNSKVRIYADDLNPSTLMFEDVKVYWPDNNQDDAEDETKYILNSVWALLSSQVPFPTPASPFGMILDNDDNSGVKEIDNDAAEITFDDPVPHVEDQDSITHNIDWKYSVRGGLEPGWHYVGVKRNVNNGYYQRYRWETNFNEESEYEKDVLIGF